MSQTFLLPPATAVRMIWARTGGFSDDHHSQIAAQLSEDALRNIRDRAETEELERKYIESAIATMDSTFRNLDIIHKGRELNFKENETLRQAYLDNIKDNFDFGKNLGDYVKSLPSMGLLGAGSVTLAEKFGIKEDVWALAIAAAAIGHMITQVYVWIMRKRMQKQYIAQDYERSMYYDQYISRAAATLTSLYFDLDRLHRNVFGQPYPVDAEASDIIGDMLKGVRPTFCPYVHKHIKERRVQAKQWTICETGKPDAIKTCPIWEG